MPICSAGVRQEPRATSVRSQAAACTPSVGHLPCARPEPGPRDRGASHPAATPEPKPKNKPRCPYLCGSFLLRQKSESQTKTIQQPGGQKEGRASFPIKFIAPILKSPSQILTLDEQKGRRRRGTATGKNRGCRTTVTRNRFPHLIL